jgi:hypothetical protein
VLLFQTPLLLMPAGPGAPSAPIAPEAPVAPCGPCGPAGPCGPVGPCTPCGPTDINTVVNCAVWLVKRFPLLSKETAIGLPGVGTSAIPLLVNVPFSHACTVEVRFSDRHPVLDTGTALRIFVPSAGAPFQVIVPPTRAR